MSEFSELAQQHIDITKQSFGVDLGFDEASIKKLDELIDEGWGGRVPENLDAPVTFFGSFFGEAIIKNLGGTWKERDGGGWVVELVGQNGDIIDANVFSKVKKRFINGEEDLLFYFYQMLKDTVNDGARFLSNTSQY